MTVTVTATTRSENIDGDDARPAAATVATVVPGVPAGRDLASLRAAIEPTVDALGYELVHLEWAAAGVLRVYIDAPGGIRVDDCEAVSRRLDAQPAADDALRAVANLEVSSPGLDRPLVTPAHFRRFTGHLARIVLREAAAATSDGDVAEAVAVGRRKFTGALVEAGDDGVALEVDGARVELAYRDMASARIAPAF